MPVSVITPVYNEEKNLVSCYSSLCEQSLNGFEWVVIDDGSSDNTEQILKCIVNKHDDKKFTIKILKQKNQGAAAARKLGVQASTYDILSIFDCDDRLSPCALELAEIEFSNLNSSDIVMYSASFVDKDKKFDSEFVFNFQSWPVSGYDAFLSCIDGWGVHGWFAVRKDIYLSALELMQGGSGNNINDDELLTRFMLFKARKVTKCKGIYFYTINPDSTTNRLNKKYYRIINTAIILDDFIHENFATNDVKFNSNRNLAAVLFCVFIRYSIWYFKLDNRQSWMRSMQHISKRISIKILIKKSKSPFDFLKNCIKSLIIILILVTCCIEVHE